MGHDRGVAIALDRLRRRPDDVRGVALMEAHVRPLPDWDAFDEGGKDLFQRLRLPRVGERMVLEQNFFVDTLLPAALLRTLRPEELAVYREPYQSPTARMPLLRWAREIPVGGEPADVHRLGAAAAENLTLTTTPILLVHGSPGVLVTADAVAWCRDHLRCLTVREVAGPTGHFLPEDRPDAVADALLSWVQDIA